jgi:hypothetical protein
MKMMDIYRNLVSSSFTNFSFSDSIKRVTISVSNDKCKLLGQFSTNNSNERNFMDNNICILTFQTDNVHWNINGSFVVEIVESNCDINQHRGCIFERKLICSSEQSST